MRGGWIQKLAVILMIAVITTGPVAQGVTGSNLLIEKTGNLADFAVGAFNEFSNAFDRFRSEPADQPVGG